MMSFLEVWPPVQRLDDARSLATLFRCVAGAALLGALGACGGGGGYSAPAPPPPAPVPAPSGPLAAVLSVPVPVGYDADRLAAFNRLNEIRLSAGLGMLAQQPSMDQAAQAHADWEVENDVYGHEESSGTPQFTGVDWWNRDAAVGYVPLEGDEVLASGYASADAVDVLANVAYHRIAILAIEPVDVGIGRSSAIATNVSEPIVIDIAVPDGDPVRGQGQLAQAGIDAVAIWPLDDAQGVRTRMGAEIPDPVPAVDVTALGTPVSLTVGNSRGLDASTFVLTNAATGAIVQSALLTHLSDPNLLIPASYVVAVPIAPLSPNTTYAVAFTGAVTELSSGASAPLARNWRFTTGEQ